MMIQIRRYVRRCWQAIQNPLNPTNIWLLSLMLGGNPDQSQLHESVISLPFHVACFVIQDSIVGGMRLLLYTCLCVRQTVVKVVRQVGFD